MVRLWRKLAGGVGQVKGSFHPNSVSFTPLMTADKVTDLRNMFQDAYTGWLEIDQEAA
jgi:hypothetical protein